MKAFSAGAHFAVAAAGEMAEFAVDLEVAGVDPGVLRAPACAGRDRRAGIACRCGET